MPALPQTPLVQPNASYGFERLPQLFIDVDRLRAQILSEVVGRLPPIMQSSSFGGWSVYSSTGSYRDSWDNGSKVYGIDGQIPSQEEVASLKKMDEVTYRQPTEICTGYIAEIMTEIESLGLKPSRARISLIQPRSAISWHRDTEDHQYGVRLHIPIVTNPGCFFETRTERYAMPADGSAYLVRVNCEHRAYNDGSETRYHIIMSVEDRLGLSQYQHYQD